MSDSSAASAPAIQVDLSTAKVPSTPQAPQTAPAAPEAKAPEAKPTDKFAAKFAALTRKERDVRERETKWKSESESIKAESEKVKAEAEQYRNKYGQFESLAERVKADKSAGVKWLLSQGLSVEDLSDALLEEMNPNAERKLERTTSDIEKRLMARLEELEGKLTAKEKAELESQKQAEQDTFEKTVTQVKTELREFIDAGDDYELIKLSGEYETVFDVMQEHYNDQVTKGVSRDKIKILSYEEAAKWTEAYLEEDARTKYEAKRAKLVTKTEPAKSKPTSPTLSNTLSTEVQNSEEPKARTREESLKRAARLLRYNEE